MNDTDFFKSPFQTVHFLSIANAINVLSNILYQEKLITQNDQYKSVPLVNGLCQHLNKINNSENSIINLGKKLLNNTEFYGSNENETINFEYVDAMLDNIIASIVFSRYGNTFGYLLSIVNATNNLTLPFIKRKIIQDLGKKMYLNQDYTLSTLSPLSVERITEKLIFPLFPEVIENSQLQIIDTDYIYAQAGLMFARSAGINSENTSFEEYITIAQSIEHGVRLGQLNHTALKIFQLPALLYNVYNNREIFNNRFDLLVNDPEFWTDVFHHLFSDLEVLKQNITSVQKTSPVYRFEQAIFRYKNRTEYAEYLIRRICPLLDEAEYETEVERYKNNPDDYHCKMDDSLMPDINQLFSEQNEHIANLYSHVEIAMIEEVFPEKLIKFIEQTNVTVFPIEIQKSRCGFRCEPFREKLNSDTILFQTSVNGTNHVLYALSLKNNNVELHSSENDLFMEKVGLQPRTLFQIPLMAKPLKGSHETFRELLTNLVKPKKLAFYNHIQKLGYESTTMESILEVLKNFIPFHNCVQAAKTETTIVAVCTCLMDSLVLIPLIGQAVNSGLKFFNAAVKPLLKFRTSLKSFTIGQFVDITLKNFAAQTGNEFSKLLTRELFQDVGVSIIRTLDPGVEFSYSLGKAGVTAVSKCLKIIGQKMPSLTNVIESLNTVKQSVLQVGSFQGRKLFVGSLTGKDGYGIKYFKFEGRTVELRLIRDYQNRMPVVLVSKPGGKKIYQIINLESGELSTTRWELNAEDVLEVETKPFLERLNIIKEEGLSGRGRLINPRIRLRKQSMEMKVEMISEWNNRIDENLIAYVLDNYVVEDPALRTVTFQHLETHGKLPDWIKHYKLTNTAEYETLRFNSYVEDVLLSEEEAVERAVALFKHKFRSDFTEINPYVLYDTYQLLRLHSIINFDDFSAIGQYLSNGFEKALLESPEGWSIQNAFYKVALRLVDFPAYDAPRSFYKFDQVCPEIFRKFIPGEYKQFNFLTKVNADAAEELENVRKIVYPNKIATNVLYEIVVDNPYLVVDVGKIFPQVKSLAVVLPNAEFAIQEVICQNPTNDIPVFKIVLRNTPISKSKWIATLNQNIETLNEYIVTYNNVLDDFDINLFN